MSQICDYCDDEHDGRDTVYTIISHGVGPHNKETRKFCSVVCRTWWRRRCSDDLGAWEQPHTSGYQGRLDRFVTDDHDDRSESASGAVAARPTSERASGAVAARPTSESATGQEATA